MASLAALQLAAPAHLNAQPSERRALELKAERVRRHGLPSQFDPSAATLATRGEALVWAATVGIERAARCVMVIVSGGEAASLTYRHEDRATACVGVTLGDRGDVYLRGLDPTLALSEVASGFTARLDSSGQLIWSVDDQRLIDAEEQAEGGSGDFTGTYGAPEPWLVLDLKRDLLLSSSRSSITLGTFVSPLSQAHVIDASSGRLERSGVGFGSNGLGLVAEALRAPGEGAFLVRTQEILAPGGAFFGYDGKSRITRLDPFAASWEERLIAAVKADAQRDLLVIVWSEAGAEGPWTLSALSAGEPLYEVRLPGEVIREGEEIALKQPFKAALGSRYLVLHYLAGGEEYVQIIAAGSAEVLGGVWLKDVFEQVGQVVEIKASGEQGRLRIFSWDRATSSIEEYDWEVSEATGPGLEPGDEEMGEQEEDMGQGGAEIDRGTLSGAQFCALSAAPSGREPGRGDAALWALLGGALLLGWRRGLWPMRRS